jgi:hypothetical protein
MTHSKVLAGTLVLTTALGALAAAAAAPAAAFPAADYGAGGYTLSFDGKGGFRLLKDADHAVRVDGSYAVEGTQIQLSDKSGPDACTGDKAKGTYRWSVDGGALVMTKIADPCDERAGDLTGTHWMHK